MALKGSTTEEKIWNYLVGNGLSKCGAAGLMGNLYAESGLRPTNLQNSFEKKLGFTDDTYTTSVDNGDYQNFVRDGAGYGLAQWTYWKRRTWSFCSSRDLQTRELQFKRNVHPTVRSITK